MGENSKSECNFFQSSKASFSFFLSFYVFFFGVVVVVVVTPVVVPIGNIVLCSMPFRDILIS